MFKNKKVVIRAGENIHKVSTWDIVKSYFRSKLPKQKQSSITDDANSAMPDTKLWDSVNHIAIILDDKVEDVIRTQDRMAALLLSQPTFVEYIPDSGDQYPVIGAKHVNGKFVVPENEESDANKED
jgi:hypothetical protein